jgi:hypothetical protein
MQNFNIPSFDWFSTMFSSRLVIGASANASLDPSALPFDGSISCLQMFAAGPNMTCKLVKLHFLFCL